MKKILKKKETLKKILIVDDEPAVCNMLKRFLTKKGYKATSVLSGEEALKKVEKDKPHVVLLDIKMPKMDGIEVLKKIKEFTKEIPIVVMVTAVNDEVIGKRCMELGAYDYITKPLGLEYLETVLMVKLFDLKIDK